MSEKRKVIVENLKHWYVIDSILLNEHAAYRFKNGKDFREYVSIKTALLSTLFEYYSQIGYVPTTKDVCKNSRVLQESAVELSKKGKDLAARMIQKDSFKTAIKSYIVKESKTRKISNIKEFSNRVITERFLRMSMDNILIGVPLLESRNPENSKGIKGEILEEAYRMSRNALIHLVKTSKLLSKEESKKVRLEQKKSG